MKEGGPRVPVILGCPHHPPRNPAVRGHAWHQIFSSCNSSDVLQLMGKKQGRREICVPQSSHCQKWCFVKTPWQPSTTRHLIFMHLSNAHQSLIFCFGTTTWVLLLPSCTSVLLKSACCDTKWKFPKADVAGKCWASGSKPKQNLVNALKEKSINFLETQVTLIHEAHSAFLLEQCEY